MQKWETEDSGLIQKPLCTQSELSDDTRGEVISNRSHRKGCYSTQEVTQGSLERGE